ncbi:MAG: D-alanyl-D-alanine carboxypeptidase, partial [Selenomonadales bacterium]|nr:D-alanyl-D-alanine carboxypeptidase [Selenomonadales bacterium]
ILAIEEVSPLKIIGVSEYAAQAEGSSAKLQAGDRIQMQDALYGLMLPSGNDAAIAIAEHIDGSTEAFAERMTQKAHDLGAVNTQFVNPNGLPDERHYTTARDLAVIASYAYQSKRFRNIVKLEKRSIRVWNTNRTIAYRNTNALLGRMDGCDGIKTGMTRAAGQCLVASASRGGVSLIAVVMKAADGQRWQEAQDLLEYGFGQMTENKTAA